jgi:uncharacterized membrane protein (UPF0127 family)
MTRRSSFAATLCLLIGLVGCDSPSAAPQTLRTTKMQIGSRNFTLEVADTPDTTEFGLMKRDSMPADHGMIFVFSQDEPRSFWMKNTRIPLDIVYVKSDGTVVSMHQMKPYDLRPTPSDAPAKYAIELNWGTLAATGVHVGDRLQIPADARDPAK